jgi:hypothetical protein
MCGKVVRTKVIFRIKRRKTDLLMDHQLRNMFGPGLHNNNGHTLLLKAWADLINQPMLTCPSSDS